MRENKNPEEWHWPPKVKYLLSRSPCWIHAPCWRPPPALAVVDPRAPQEKMEVISHASVQYVAFSRERRSYLLRLSLGSNAERNNHRVDRVLSFFSSRPNWDSPTPLTRIRVPVPPPRFGSGGGTFACGRGGGGVPIRTRWQTLWYSRYICPLWQ